MGPELNRWLAYTKAKIRDALRSGHRKLDEAEARLEADRAEKPWLSRDGEELSLDQVRARIEWEERRAAESRSEADDGGATGRSAGSVKPSEASRGRHTEHDRPRNASPSEASIGDEAEMEAVRLEMDRRQRDSRERLEEIRRELGVDPPPDAPPADGDDRGSS